MVLTLLLLAALPAAPLNLDLEEGDPAGAPTGWFVPRFSADGGCSAALTVEDKRSGARSVLLTRTGGPADRFGNLMQTFDAAAYRGRRVSFRAAVRTDLTPRSQAALWLRIDRANGNPGFFDNMGDRPIVSKDWAEYEIAGDVATDAETVNLGVMLLGSGKVWFDSVSFKDLGPSGEGNQAPHPLEGRGLANLVAFTRLLGYVRYFHPSDEAAAADWNKFAIEAVPIIEPARDAADLAAQLERVFRPLAPTVRVCPTGAKCELPAELATIANSGRAIHWRHHGLGKGDSNAIYWSKRTDEATTTTPRPAEPLRADLGAGVSCLVPLALGTDAQGTLPRAIESDGDGDDARPPGWIPSGNDRATRLAAVALAWNVFQHFYPYFDVVKTDWPAELRRALESAAKDPNERAFLDTLRRLNAALHDGHGHVNHPSESAPMVPPMLWEWIENRLVVTTVGDDAKETGLRPGAIVLTTGGRPVGQALTALEPLISAATPQWARHRALQELARGQRDSPLELTVRGADGKERHVSLPRTRPLWGEEMLRETRPGKIATLEEGIEYVDCSRITDQDLTDALDRLAQAKGIVFDMRGYPSFEFTTLVAHLITSPVTSARWNIPVLERPDRQGTEFAFSNWTVNPVAPRFTGRIAFLTDGRAISAAETFLGIVEHYRLATIVGGPTAGTNGNVNPLTLPGGYQLTWTGMQVLKHDGSRHHGVGILPNVAAERTISGVAAGRDEVLERGAREVRGVEMH